MDTQQVNQVCPGPSGKPEPTNVLEVKDLSVSFHTEEGPIQVLDEVSFTVPAGKTVGLVGESGCGKSVSVMTVMRLLPSPPSFIKAGQVLFEGEDLLKFSSKEMQGVRGNRIGMIFQDPMTSLNPTFTIGFQLIEVLKEHRNLNSRDASTICLELIRMIGIGAPEKRMRQYPHQLSGGLRQRIMIAMALVCKPRLLIADEPTTALDVTIQAQILDLLASLQAELGMSILLITHDLGVVAETCSEVYVMYAGRIVEYASMRRLFARPAHPYTLGLMNSIPRLDTEQEWLPTIPGMVPSPGKRDLGGCYFADRCSKVMPKCHKERPKLIAHEPGHAVACWDPYL